MRFAAYWVDDDGTYMYDRGEPMDKNRAVELLNKAYPDEYVSPDLLQEGWYSARNKNWGQRMPIEVWPGNKDFVRRMFDNFLPLSLDGIE